MKCGHAAPSSIASVKAITVKNDEKKCPSCAEAIKLDAVICRHCRHEFSQDELVASKQAAAAERRRRAIDKALRNHASADTLKELSGENLRPDEIAEISRDIGVSQSEIELRAKKLGMDLYDVWSEEQEVAIDRALLANSWNDSNTCTEIADQFGAKWGQVYDRAHEVGVPFIAHGQKPPSLSGLQSIYRKPLIVMGAMIAAFLAITLFSNYLGDSGSGATSPNNPAVAGMSNQNEAKYDNLDPKGREYVDDQMKKYDEFCNTSSEC